MKMLEDMYAVYNEYGTKLADNMTWEMALAFMRGYKEMFYNEAINLTIKEIDNQINVDEDHKRFYKELPQDLFGHKEGDKDEKKFEY